MERNMFHIVQFGVRLLSGGSDEAQTEDQSDDGHSDFGVHISFDDLYHSVLFFACIYLSGFISSRLLFMPSLVGEIVCGILLGPPLADFVPNPEAFVMLGEIGLILLVLEAGIDIDMTTLKLIGTRGVLIAIVGSILPIAIGIAIAFAIGTDLKGSLAAGAAFGPTSLGIAMNVLRAGKIVNTPVGQLIVSAAVIDDMIALIILSQLEALAGEITVSSVLIPIVSALGYLVLGGYIAIAILPGIIHKVVLSRVKAANHAKVELAIMFGILIGLMPATYYSRASFLMGAFVAGLTFCRSHDLHALFVTQFKRVLQWLMRIFFAASIGFQVPVKDFGNGKVIWQGALFTLALTGKLAVGFMVPNFNQQRRFTGLHMRDCLVTGFSMAAEGEFAFVIAVFAVDQELISKDLYASIVLAVLFSTILPPFLLRFTINYFNKKQAEVVQRAADAQIDRIESMVVDPEDREKQLWENIKNNSTLFLCIQTRSDSQWGLLHSLMNCMNRNHLEVIDHRNWHPRGVNTTLVNEVYAKDNLPLDITLHGTDTETSVQQRIDHIKQVIEKVLPGSPKVKVQRWYPGILEEIVEESTEKINSLAKKQYSLGEKLFSEASDALEKNRDKQTNMTVQKTPEQIRSENFLAQPKLILPERGPVRRRRQKMRSTPVVGGSLFDESRNASKMPLAVANKHESGAAQTDMFNDLMTSKDKTKAELIVDGETYHITITNETLDNVRKGFMGETIRTGGINVAANTPLVNRLQGFVRTVNPLGKIMEEATSDAQSDTTDN